MNREEIIRMAREVWGDDSGKPWHESAVTHLEAFANLVAAAEREACAQVAEAYEPRCDICPSGVAFAIRERGAP